MTFFSAETDKKIRQAEQDIIDAFHSIASSLKSETGVKISEIAIDQDTIIFRVDGYRHDNWLMGTDD